MKLRFAFALCALGLLLFTGAVIADEEPNNDVENAEKMSILNDVSGNVGNEDNVDFYYIDVTPKTILKLSVEYMPTTGGPYAPFLTVEARIRNKEKVEFQLDITGSQTDIKEVEFKNKEKDTVQLYIKVSGYASYVLDPEITTSVDTICCGSTVLLGVLGLTGVVVALVAVRKRFG
jgi:hypothetical protein